MYPKATGLVCSEGALPGRGSTHLASDGSGGCGRKSVPRWKSNVQGSSWVLRGHRDFGIPEVELSRTNLERSHPCISEQARTRMAQGAWERCHCYLTMVLDQPPLPEPGPAIMGSAKARSTMGRDVLSSRAQGTHHEVSQSLNYFGQEWRVRLNYEIKEQVSTWLMSANSTNGKLDLLLP